MLNIIKIMIAYTILHVTYVDMGLDVGDKYLKLIRHPFVFIPLMIAITFDNLDYDLNQTAMTVSLFSVLMLWGNNRLNLPFLDHLISA